MNIRNLTVKQLSDAVLKGELSSSEIAGSYLSSIKESDLNSFITVSAPEVSANSGKILSGIPFGVKDNICTKNVATTCGSKMLMGFVPPYDATVVSSLKSNGAVMIGKLNMDEFGMGSSCEKSYFGAVKNPHNPDFVAGGSSGGSAAAVSAGLVPFALGSDTGGSVRLPASFCGVVGIKPSYGRISRYGLVSFAPSLDHVGIITKNVFDAAFLLEIIAGFDSLDNTSSKADVPKYTDGIEESIRGMKIAIPLEYIENIDEDIKKAILTSAKKLMQEGAEIEYISLGFLNSALAAYYIISSAESSSNLARFDGVRYGFRASNCKDINEIYVKSRSEGFGDEVKRRIMLGTFVLSQGFYDDYYKKALCVRADVKYKLGKIFEKYDLILSPVSPVTCYKSGFVAKSTDMYFQDMFTVPANLAGLPAISVPCCKDSKNLPVGVQLIGGAFKEKDMLRAAYTLELSLGGWKNE